MRIRAILIVAALFAASLGVAQGQQAVVTSSPKGPSGLSFAFDAPSGQLTASGFTVNLTPNTSSSLNLTGTVDVTLIVNVVSKFPTGTTFPCAAIVIGGELNTKTVSVAGGIETANGLGTHSSAAATSVTCTLTIPYEWTMPGATSGTDSGIVVGFAVGAVNPTGKILRSSIQLGAIDSLPANGTTTKFTFHAAL